MGQKVFIPMTDELLFDRPELISSPLRPYSQDLPCFHWLNIELNPADLKRDSKPRASAAGHINKAYRERGDGTARSDYSHFVAA